jgi:magnesium chelatase subunit D
VLAPDPTRATLVVARDLAAISLEAQRALVASVGAEVVHLERHGRSERWSMYDTIWLAACARADVGRVSPHLLDRFALRVDGAGIDPAFGTTQLRAAIENRKTAAPKVIGLASRAALRAAARRDADLTSEAIERVLHHVPGSGSARRSVALARLALALARLGGASQSRAEHVDRAADLIGLIATSAPITPEPTPPPLPADPSPPVTKPRETSEPTSQASIQPPSAEVTVPIAPIESTPVAVIAAPYPEDHAPIDRQLRALALPSMERRASARAIRGVAVGIMQAHDFRDIALTATLIEASKYRVVRKRFVITGADLRAYRRVAPVERMLAVLIDYTALAGWDWGGAVLPFLHDAYAQRSSICFVQVGALSSEGELRARHTVSRSLLAAPLDDVLGADPGVATPLAHGLELAFEVLRHELQHGRGIAARADLIVVTDARGNIPLEASRRGVITGPVRDEGFRDALSVAERLRVLDRLSCVLIHPRLEAGADLPMRLASAMGATLRAPVEPEEDP